MHRHKKIPLDLALFCLLLVLVLSADLICTFNLGEAFALEEADD